MNAIYRRQENTEFLEMEGEYLVLDQDAFTVTKLNELGGKIWSLIDGSRTAEQLAELIAAQFRGVEPQRIREDVRLFLERLTSFGLIRIAG
jgi:hypothetical protein